MRRGGWRLGTLLVMLPVMACSGAATSGQRTSSDPAAASQSSAQSRSIVVAYRYEKNDLSTKTLTQAGQEYRTLFNAGLAYVDGEGKLKPYLAAGLPELNTPSWQVLPDGRMETRYALRPDLTWHDGRRLTADDFVFGWQVYATRGIGIFSPQPQDQMEAVEAVDAGTLLIRWRSVYPDAAVLTNEEFPPLPRHLLQAVFDGVESDPIGRDAFVNHRYWTTDYVAAGPYRLTQLEPGAFVEGEAFASHALGKPKIDRIVARIVADENAVLSSILSDAIQVATSITLRFEHALVLNREWGQNKKGNVSWAPGRMVASIFQFRPDYQKTAALFDGRVRRALVYSVDREALNEGLFEGQSPIPEGYLGPSAPNYQTVQRAITRYSYDPRMTEQLMTEAGFARDRESFFADQSGERFRPDYQVLTGTQFERGGDITVAGWRSSGIEVQYQVLPAAQVRQNDVRNTFPGMSTPGGININERGLVDFFTIPQIGSPSNGWTGSNRGGWVHPEYDRLFSAYNVTLDRQERDSQVAGMLKILSDEVPGFPLYFDFNVVASVARVKGPSLGIVGTSSLTWNVHEWEIGP